MDVGAIRFWAAMVGVAVVTLMPLAAMAASPLARQTFLVDGRPAFIIAPTKKLSGPTPWVMYAPTLGKGLPGGAEYWMFRQWLDAGIAIAGVDVGESYGSPKGRATYNALHKQLTEKHGFAAKASLLARSRGGLMLYCWAADNPEKVQCIAGIYPVCNLVSYPGLARACGAYGMTEAELTAELARHNPVDRLAPLAKAGVPIFHIHGDKDGTVPLDKNSALLARRYRAAGGTVALQIAKGQGHNMWRGFFECQPLVDFVIRKGAAEKSPETPKELTLDLGNKVTMKLALIPAGKFLMGSAVGEKDRLRDEGPQREVIISKPFYMGVHEVTQEQYEQVMGKNPSKFKGAKNPVETVSWNDAVLFCKGLADKTGKTVQLPTEAQWEYACRAGSKTRFCFGDDDSGFGGHAWYRRNSDDKTHPVGGKKPNAFGLYDMHGNVWEWCSDWWAGSDANAKNRDPSGPDSGTDRVLRGGCWINDPQFCRSASRAGGNPVGRSSNSGFRVAVLAAGAASPSTQPATQLSARPYLLGDAN